MLYEKKKEIDVMTGSLKNKDKQKRRKKRERKKGRKKAGRYNRKAHATSEVLLKIKRVGSHGVRKWIHFTAKIRRIALLLHPTFFFFSSLFL